MPSASNRAARDAVSGAFGHSKTETDMKSSAQTGPAFEMPTALAARIQHGPTPVTHQEWVVKKEDPENILRRAFGEWMQNVSKNEAMFKKYVYDNNEMADIDLRQHRARLCELISAGEFLAMGFSAIAEITTNKKEFLPFIESIDQTVKKLLTALIQWHGQLSAQLDIPESFKQAAQEVEEGKILDLDI